jgi:DNA mismatch endonuclease, patch repair protein
VTGIPKRAWQPKPGRSRSAAQAEQDKAAGGRHRRVVSVSNDEACRGSIVLKPMTAGNQINAYLRWRSEGRTRFASLGVVSNSSRIVNLAEAWDRARAEGMVRDEEPPSKSWASSPEVRATMQGNRGRDTTPELHLRALLHARGLRYRVSARPLPDLRRTADIVFPSSRVAVFVDGCYWHGCPDHHRPATKNSEFWKTKIAENRRRDAETNRVLAEHGWTVVRCWEHEDLAVVADRIDNEVRNQV